jgi:hypothetical protein
VDGLSAAVSMFNAWSAAPKIRIISTPTYFQV